MRVLGWQWHQLDHMQTICTLLQTDNHINTSLLNFCRPDDLPDDQPTVSKHWRQHRWCNKNVTVTNEPGELLPWLWSWWQHHKRCRSYYYHHYITIIIIMCWKSKDRLDRLRTRERWTIRLDVVIRQEIIATEEVIPRSALRRHCCLQTKHRQHSQHTVASTSFTLEPSITITIIHYKLDHRNSLQHMVLQKWPLKNGYWELKWCATIPLPTTLPNADLFSKISRCETDIICTH